MNHKKRKALFLDRDGVINVDKGYVCKIEEFEFIDGIFDICKKAKDLGYLIFVVTNQSGIGRGYYSEDDFHKLMNFVEDQFRAKGIAIEKVYFCPYHAENGIGKYKKESFDRKPNPGMILKAEKEFNLDLASSIMIGDNEKDIQAAIAAGVGKKVLVSLSDADSVSTKADMVISSLYKAINNLFPA